MSAPNSTPISGPSSPTNSQVLPSRPPPSGHAPNRARPPRRRPANPMVLRKQTNYNKQIGFRKRPEQEAVNRISLEPLEELKRCRQMYNGWSDPPPNTQYFDYPVVTTKRELREAMRVHAMRFQKNKGGEEQNIDPCDKATFTRPVTLHRRDPRQPPPGRAPPKEPTPEPTPVDDKEAQRLAELKAAKETQRAEDQSKIAPGVKEQKQPKQKPKEEKINLNRMPTTVKGKKQSDLRYEEALPWHLEDAEGKNVWVGSYESALSEHNVALVIDGPKFRMIPIEKWYKFTAKPPFTPLSAEQAEEMLRKDTPISRWLKMKQETQAEDQKRMQEWRTASGPARRRQAMDTRDYDEVDMDPGDEFQDDDETGGLFDFDDEDVKDSNERIRKNQLGANLFGEADEKDLDQMERQARKEEKVKREKIRQLKKISFKRAHENALESDESDSDPFRAVASTDDESSTDEEEEETEIKKEDIKVEDIKKEEDDKILVDPKNDSPNKAQAELLKKKKGLKRAGSPGASESSGNESSRKKNRIKKAVHSGSIQRRKTGLAGNMSDGENTAGEMSDSQPRKKIKLVSKASPSGSRAGSPAAPVPASIPTHKLTVQEIIDALPPYPTGISVLDFFRGFTDRVGNGPNMISKAEWLKAVQQNADYGPDKLLRRKQ